jgi:outer membrane lipoprotein carrier protein
MAMPKSFSYQIRIWLFWAVSHVAFANTSTDLLGEGSAALETPILILEHRLTQINSFKGQFVQQTFSMEEELLDRSEGYFQLQRPGNFYWRVDSPDQHLLISDGSQIWDYDIDLEQVIHRQIGGADQSDSPMQIISGDAGVLAAGYTVEVSDLELDLNQSFILYPLRDGGSFSKLLLVFSNIGLVSMEMTDPFQQVTKIEFLHTTVNELINEATFDFFPPVGIDFISGGWNQHE